MNSFQVFLEVKWLFEMSIPQFETHPNGLIHYNYGCDSWEPMRIFEDDLLAPFFQGSMMAIEKHTSMVPK